MEKLNIVNSVFIIELLVDFLVLKIFKIRFKFLYLLFLQIPKICASVICVEFNETVGACVLAKFLSKLICILFLSDTLKLKKIACIFFSEIMLLFSIGGFVWFLTIWLKISIENIFHIKFATKWQFLLIFSIILYIFAFFMLVRFIENNKKLRGHLTKLSLKLFDRHIIFYGLIDSGNSLVDPKTGKSVILISIPSLSKYLSSDKIDWLIKVKCRNIKCETISGTNFEIPIFENDVFLKLNDELEKINCMVGLVNQKFENGKFDCLLHRDYL